MLVFELYDKIIDFVKEKFEALIIIHIYYRDGNVEKIKLYYKCGNVKILKTYNGDNAKAIYYTIITLTGLSIHDLTIGKSSTVYPNCAIITNYNEKNNILTLIIFRKYPFPIY